MIFKRLTSLLTAAFLVLATLPITPAQANYHHGVASGPCPQAIDNGCLGAQSTGSLKNVSLLTSAQQSGQTSLLPSRAGGALTLNIPCVDYWCGPSSALTPQDPRTINTAHCQYSGSPNFAVLCTANFNGEVVHESFDNYDFGGTKIGQSSVGLYAYSGHQAGAGSTLTVTNSYFSLLPSGAWPGVGANTNWSLTVYYNEFDGSAATASSAFPIAVDTDALGDAHDIRYNVFKNLGVGRVAGGLTNSTFTLRYNYIQGLNDLITTNHGELMLRNCSAPGRSNCTPFDDYEGNFIVWSCCLTWPMGYGDNATVFPGDGSSDGVQLTSFTFKDNIVVTNASTSGGLQPDQALFNSRLATMGTVTITGNWVDATGANDCSISGVKAAGPQVTASSSGNTLTITGFATPTNWGNDPIEPGWLIIHSGFTTTPITAYGTGVGNTGTYIFGGPTQAIPSDSNWTLVPGYSGTPTLTSNWNLADPSHTGIPVAMGLNGPQFTATHCSPWY